MSEKELFAKIDSETLREKIYQGVIEVSPELQVQLQDNSLITVKSYRRIKNDLVVFRQLDDQPESQNVILNFIFDNERYFLKTKLTQKDKNCFIALSPLLYKLQRRKNFRLQLPQSWAPKFECKLQNIEKVAKNFLVLDLSSGGFSFEFNAAEFQIEPGAELDGQLKIRNKLDLHVKAKVRHYRDSGTKAFPKVRVGAEFIGLSTKEEQTIMAFLMEVHREVFSRLK
tara:strand:+ start:4804 stop:5484 length:681 start_codon:yes stop_codon:yes gene_type:complete